MIESLALILSTVALILQQRNRSDDKAEANNEDLASAFRELAQAGHQWVYAAESLVHTIDWWAASGAPRDRDYGMLERRLIKSRAYINFREAYQRHEGLIRTYSPELADSLRHQLAQLPKDTVPLMKELVRHSRQNELDSLREGLRKSVVALRQASIELDKFVATSFPLGS
jgi:hypothetical protein